MGEKDGSLAPAAVNQTALNVAHYADIYAKCLAEARRIMGDRGNPPKDQTLQVAGDIFDRFFRDQVELAGKERTLERITPVIEAARAWLDRQSNFR